MTEFLRTAAKEKATALVERQRRITLSEREVGQLLAALDAPFRPTAALEKALHAAQRTIRRA